MRILIVDDEAIIRKGLRKIISRFGFEFEVVGEAENANEALDYIETVSPDVIITDIKMPEMDGIELTAKISELNRSSKSGMNIKCIILSGYGEFSYAKEALKYGVSEYILKPVNEEELKTILVRMKDQINEENLRLKNLELYVEKGLLALKEKTFRNILFNGIEALEDLETALRDIGVLFKHSAFIVVCVKLDKESVKNRSVNINDIINYSLIKKLNEELIQIYYTVISEDEVVLIINFNLVDNGIDVNPDMVSKLKQGICISEVATVSLGISDVFFDFNDVRLQYENSKKVLDLRFFKGGNSIFYYSHLSNYQKQSDDINFEEISSKVRLIVLSGNLDELQKFIDELFEIISSGCYIDRNMLQGLMYFILQKITAYSIELFRTKVHFFEKDDFLIELNRYEYIKDVQLYIHNLFASLVNNIHEDKLDKNAKLMKSAGEYMEQHYCEDLSLGKVADHIYLSHSYFSDLFKQEMGISFIECLINIRIEHAKTLLKDLNLKMYEISSLVGYEDSNYFSRIFKKTVGISPVEFRNKIG